MNSIVWFLVAIFTFLIIAVVGNLGDQSIQNIQNQIYYANCPLPIYDSIATLTDVNEFGVQYTIVYGSGLTNSSGTYFDCSIDVNNNRSANTTIKEYGATLFGFIPYGWLGYLADAITGIFLKIGAMIALITFFITPINFSIFGYTMLDIGAGAFVVIGIYIFCYIGIIQYFMGYIIGAIRSFI